MTDVFMAHRDALPSCVREEPLGDAFPPMFADRAVMDPSRAGVVVVAKPPEKLADFVRALESLGLRVEGCGSKEELVAFLVSTVQREEVCLPEVVVVEAGMLAAEPELVELLRRAGCLDHTLVILPETWPRGTTPVELSPSQVLQEPFPVSVLIEEVARRMTAASVEHVQS